MPGIAYTPLGEGTFTTEQLDRNFSAISAYTRAADEDLLVMTNAVHEIAKGLVETVQKVEKIQHALANPKPSNGAIVLALVTGAYVGYRIYNSSFFKAVQAEEKRRDEEPIRTSAERVDNCDPCATPTHI